MENMSSDDAIQVTIFGKSYYIRGGEDPEHTRELAASVNEKMSLIAGQVSGSDDFRVAVLTALHLADEFDVLQKKHEALQEEISSKAKQLGKLFDALERGGEEPTATVLSAAD